jgi:hypothetical protein
MMIYSKAFEHSGVARYYMCQLLEFIEDAETDLTMETTWRNNLCTFTTEHSVRDDAFCTIISWCSFKARNNIWCGGSWWSLGSLILFLGDVFNFCRILFTYAAVESLHQ